MPVADLLTEITHAFQDEPQQLSQNYQALNQFIARASRLTPLQAKTVYHFLKYLLEAGSAAQRQAAAVAIERYWFQFA